MLFRKVERGRVALPQQGMISIKTVEMQFASMLSSF